MNEEVFPCCRCGSLETEYVYGPLMHPGTFWCARCLVETELDGARKAVKRLVKLVWPLPRTLRPSQPSRLGATCHHPLSVGGSAPLAPPAPRDSEPRRPTCPRRDFPRPDRDHAGRLGSSGNGVEVPKRRWGGIENHLDGPDLIPGEDEPYADDAQRYYDLNRSRPMPACAICGIPSHIGWKKLGFCSWEHERQYRAGHPGGSA
jgi:hypothetical protein